MTEDNLRSDERRYVLAKLGPGAIERLFRV